MHRRARWTEYHLVRSPVRTRAIRLDTASLQICPRLVLWPCPDYVSAQGYDLPWFQFGSPSGHLLRMLAHELLHPSLKRLANSAQLRIQILVVLLSNLAVPPHSLPVILRDIL